MGTEKRYPILLPSNQKEVIISTNSLLAMVLIIKLAHMHLALLTGVLKKCLQLVNGMVYVRMCLKDLMLKIQTSSCCLCRVRGFPCTQSYAWKCGETWLENNPEFLDVNRVTTDTPFPEMSNDDAFPNTSVENWLGQPVLPWNYDSGPEKAVAGLVTTEFYFDGKCSVNT